MAIDNATEGTKSQQMKRAENIAKVTTNHQYSPFELVRRAAFSWLERVRYFVVVSYVVMVVSSFFVFGLVMKAIMNFRREGRKKERREFKTHIFIHP